MHLSTTNLHLSRALPKTEQQGCWPSASVKIEPCAAAATDLQHPPVESSGSGTEMRHSALEITGRIGVQIVRYFQDLIL